MASDLAPIGCGMFLSVRGAQKRASALRKNLHEEWRRHRASKALALCVQQVLSEGVERLRAADSSLTFIGCFQQCLSGY